MPSSLSVFALASAALVASGCAEIQTQSFLHTRHRQNFAIEDQELRSLQFFISTDVLARRAHSDPSKNRSEDVVMVSAGTPGVALDVGSDWLRVTFQEGGSGVVFLADPKARSDVYWLATRVAGRRGLYKVKDLREPILLHNDTPFEVLYGANAHILVSSEDLDKLIARRTSAEGVTLDPDQKP